MPVPISLFFLKFYGDVNSQAILTLLVTYTNVIFEHLTAITICVVLECSKTLHNHNYQKFWERFWGICNVNVIMLTFPILATVFCREILEFFNFEEKYIAQLVSLIYNLFIFKIVENVNNLLSGLLLVQKIIKAQYYVNIIALIVFLSISYHVFLVVGMQAEGFIWAFGSKVIIEFLMFLGLLVFYNEIEWKWPRFGKVVKQTKNSFA